MRHNSSTDPYSNRLPNVTNLTPVEEKVWKLHKQGKKRGEIGAELNLKPVTVTRYLCTIREKVWAS